MANPPRKIAFVLATSEHGTLIVNRLDYRMVDERRGFGVGYQLLENGVYEPSEVETALGLLTLRRQYFGDGVTAIDCGANIGVHTVEWAKRMSGWGEVIAIEAQERLFYALTGNIAINNCFNARALHAAVAAKTGTLGVPTPDYLKPASFGSLELRPRPGVEFIGQPIDYSARVATEIRAVSIDSLDLARIDLIKIDVEGMELEVLEGGKVSLGRCCPVLIVEAVKTDTAKLRAFLEQLRYRLFEIGMNLLAVHESDRTLNHVKLT